MSEFSGAKKFKNLSLGFFFIHSETFCNAVIDYAFSTLLACLYRRLNGVWNGLDFLKLLFQKSPRLQIIFI